MLSNPYRNKRDPYSFGDHEIRRGHTRVSGLKTRRGPTSRVRMEWEKTRGSSLPRALFPHPSQPYLRIGVLFEHVRGRSRMWAYDRTIEWRYRTRVIRMQRGRASKRASESTNERTNGRLATVKRNRCAPDCERPS